MPNNLNVTLVPTSTPTEADVDQQGKANEVSRSPNQQTITWQLTGNAASGSFVALTDPSPGFAWVGTAPPTGIFGTPNLSGNGNQLTISVLNNSDNTVGTWIYVIRVKVGGTVYSTTSTMPTGTTKDPTIVNK